MSNRKVPHAQPDDGRINAVTGMRIKPEALMRLRQLAQEHKLSQAAMVGALVETSMEASLRCECGMSEEARA